LALEVHDFSDLVDFTDRSMREQRMPRREPKRLTHEDED
jgi:hypothetical protein